MIDAKINSTDMKSRNTMNTQKNIIKKTNSCPMFQMIWKKPVNTDKYLDHLRSKWYALISLSYYDRLIYVEYTIGRTFKNLNLGQTLWIYIYIYTHIYNYIYIYVYIHNYVYIYIYIDNYILKWEFSDRLTVISAYFGSSCLLILW